MKEHYYKCEKCNELYDKVFEGTACEEGGCHLELVTQKQPILRTKNTSLSSKKPQMG